MIAAVGRTRSGVLSYATEGAGGATITYGAFLSG